MNERIKELWDKAAQAAAAYPSGQNNSWETQVNFMEKFAELIVKECIETLRLVPYNSDREFGDEVIYQGAIRKHFGVEE